MILKIFLFSFFLVLAVTGHQNNTTEENDNLLTKNEESLPSDADLQVALMPQELNTAFIPNKRGMIIPKELQALMPQELNPVFTPPEDKNAIVVGWAPIYYYPPKTTTPKPVTPPDEEDAPWKVVLPIPSTARTRRGLDIEIPSSTSQLIKTYTRMGACIALIVSAVVEIVLYIVEWYYVVD